MIQVACAVIFKDGKILVTQRGPAMKQPLLWEFPGGKIEPGETAENCIGRELLEELNIEVALNCRLPDCAYTYPDIAINLVPFIAEFKSGIITLHEHMNFVWLPPDQLHTLQWAPADVEVMERLLEKLK